MRGSKAPIRTEYVTLYFPILHIETTYAKQRDKLIEEYNEFRKELFSEAAPERMLHELQDIIQAYLTLLYTVTKPTSLDNRETDERIIALLEVANQEHRRKIERYRVQRGWD